MDNPAGARAAAGAGAGDTGFAEGDAAAAPTRSLTPVPDLDGPKVRLGVAWAVVAFAIAVAGPLLLAVLFSMVAGLAGVQAARSWRGRARQPVPAVAGLGAMALPFAALGGVAVAAGAAVVVGVTALVVRPLRSRTAPELTLAIALGVGVAAAAPVFARQLGLAEVIVLLSFVYVYDASVFVVGPDAKRAWEAPAAGGAFILAVTIAVAAVFVPPFGGASPWILGALAAALAPVGPMVASLLLGNRAARVPALRRLDSLLVLGPLWVAATAALTT